jgi:hypothetical protein
MPNLLPQQAAAVVLVFRSSFPLSPAAAAKLGRYGASGYNVFRRPRHLSEAFVRSPLDAQMCHFRRGISGTEPCQPE